MNYAAPHVVLGDTRVDDLYALLEPPEWFAHAACADGKTNMFPGRADHAGMAKAKEVCAGCEVRPQCLEWAIVNDEPAGVWGGKSTRQRELMIGHRIAGRTGSPLRGA